MDTTARRSPAAFAFLVAASALLLTHSSRATAQTTGTTYTIGAAAGLVVPVSDLSNLTSSGYDVAITLGMHQPLVPLSFRAVGSFTELPWNGSSNVKRRIYGIGIDGLYNLGTPSTNGGLYAIGGVGYFGWKDTDIFDNGTNWNLGINAGLGYYLPLSGFTVSIEGRYRTIFSSTNQSMFPITVGVTF
jgi:hypothetical protein